MPSANFDIPRATPIITSDEAATTAKATTPLGPSESDSGSSDCSDTSNPSTSSGDIPAKSDMNMIKVITPKTKPDNKPMLVLESSPFLLLKKRRRRGKHLFGVGKGIRKGHWC